jgi:PadR family transcriptional regulator, regulatory protein AphA
MSRRSAELTTTSYAMLGMLGIRPWTTYELAQHMDRGVGRLWPPSARSNLFKEPKKLVSLGLAKATEDAVGSRRRTVYSITAKGRRALRSWLETPGEPTRIESEQLLKLFFAEHGSTDQARATVAAIADWAADSAAENIAVARSYLDGTGPFPERAAVLEVVGKFMTDFADMVAAWADWATSVIAEWPDDPGRAQPNWRTFEAIANRAGPGPTTASVREDLPR